jgi:chemotaxis protein methyltransferase CheR
VTPELIDTAEMERFRAGIVRRLGLRFEDSRQAFLAEVLQRRQERTGIHGASYVDRLDARSGFADEVRELARELTVGETYFFRNIDQFRAVADVVLPDRIAARAMVRSLSFLSAGCASGEEAYSLAMLAREQIADPRWTVSIVGIDVNPTALEKATAARYSTWSLRETPPRTQARWFSGNGRDRQLDPSIRDAVRFEERNLTEDDPVFWRAGAYDLIFCRNVLMYHTPDGMQAIVERMARALAPGGFLFLGHAENLRGVSQDFHLRHTHETFYYQRKDARGATHDSLPPGLPIDDLWGAGARAGSSGAADGTAAGLASSMDGADPATWIEAIRRATDRIQLLSREGAADGAADRTPARGASPMPPSDSLAAADARAGTAAGRRTPGPPAASARPDLAPVIESLQRERFSEALGLWHALPSASVTDPEALLLRAALLTHSGQLATAESVCAELLALDDLNAGAHYLLALCREGAGDRTAAIDHDQVAVYLDPAFAMPRLHMGLLARRAGQRDVARRELGMALPLLQREDASRLLLFGGGFNRDTLAALCRAELSAAGADR